MQLKDAIRQKVLKHFIMFGHELIHSCQIRLTYGNMVNIDDYA